MSSAHSTSSRGFAVSIKAKLALTADSDIAPPGSVAAAISCIKEAYTKSLEAVPSASSDKLPALVAIAVSRG
jgi:hypothetical protein